MRELSGSYILGFKIKTKKMKIMEVIMHGLTKKKKKYSYLYSEITGYLITFNCFIYSITKNKKNLIAAEAAASWLISQSQFTFGGFKCFDLVDKNLKIKDKSTLSYSFDNGVIINGLANLYKATKKKKYLKAAIKCAEWIIASVKKKGIVNPVYDTIKKKFVYNKKSWSMRSGSYHTKISIGLLNIYSITKKKIYLDNANAIIQKSINTQKKMECF